MTIIILKVAAASLVPLAMIGFALLMDKLCPSGPGTLFGRPFDRK